MNSRTVLVVGICKLIEPVSTVSYSVHLNIESRRLAYLCKICRRQIVAVCKTVADKQNLEACFLSLVAVVRRLFGGFLSRLLGGLLGRLGLRGLGLLGSATNLEVQRL